MMNGRKWAGKNGKRWASYERDDHLPPWMTCAQITADLAAGEQDIAAAQALCYTQATSATRASSFSSGVVCNMYYDFSRA